VRSRILSSLFLPLLRIKWIRENFYRRLPKVMPLQFRGTLEAARRKAASGEGGHRSDRAKDAGGTQSARTDTPITV
jgi:hypothetical protein